MWNPNSWRKSPFFFCFESVEERLGPLSSNQRKRNFLVPTGIEAHLKARSDIHITLVTTRDLSFNLMSSQMYGTVTLQAASRRYILN